MNYGKFECQEREKMNVKVTVQLSQLPTNEDREQMYEAAESLTNDTRSIAIIQPSKTSPILIAEFTIPTARQIDVVDIIGRAFWNVHHYSDSMISFPKKRSPQFGNSARGNMTKPPLYTPKQGQYLAFIYYYTKINGIPPAEREIQRYFRVTPPTVHQMILKLERLGLLYRVPNTPRSLRILLPKEELPELE